MAVRGLLAWVVSTVLLVGWSVLFWLFLAGPLGMVHALPGAREISRQLESADLGTGTYYVPWPRGTETEQRKFIEHHQAGGYYKISYVREGIDPGNRETWLYAVTHHAGVACLAVLLLAIANAPTVLQRVVLVSVAGALGSVFITVADPVWLHLPWDYCAGALVHQAGAWLILGVTAGVLMKSAAEQAAAAPAVAGDHDAGE